MAPAGPDDAQGLEERRDVKDLARGGFITFVGKLGRASRGAFLWVITLLMGLDVGLLFPGLGHRIDVK